MKGSTIIIAALIGTAVSQNVGTEKENINLPLQLEECTGNENCTPLNTKITMDQNWRWVHIVDGYDNCYTGNTWNETTCPDAETCTANCAVDGIDEVDWNGTYGVLSDGFEAQLTFVTQGPYSTNVGQRLFLLDESEQEYHMFYLKNREFTMDVDVSQLDCGLNGAVYFVEMDKDGGMSKYPTNKAGAAFGTGYCDAQCPHDLKYISGETNMQDWDPSDDDKNAGKGHFGSCCNELDIWEANNIATAFTVHPCNVEGSHRCEGVECGDNASGDRYNGICDKDGCDFHNWRLGDHDYYGPGPQFKVDSTKPMTVVTQFLTDDGTDTGEFVEMRRIYVQDGKVIDNSFTSLEGMDKTDSITDEFCDQAKVVFGDETDYQAKGGMKTFSKALDNGLVLVLSLWGDYEAHMLWLDSKYPLEQPEDKPGIDRGPCSQDTGDPDKLIVEIPDAYVKFSKLRVGPIGSTYPSDGSSTDKTTSVDPNHPTTAPPDPDNDCPGKTLDACIAMCPKEPIFIHNGCIKECAMLC